MSDEAKRADVEGMLMESMVREGGELMARLTQDEERLSTALDFAARNYIERCLMVIQDQEAEIAAERHGKMSEWLNDDQAAYARDMAAKPRDERCACGWYVKAECPEAKGERCYKAENARHSQQRAAP